MLKFGIHTAAWSVKIFNIMYTTGFCSYLLEIKYGVLFRRMNYSSAKDQRNISIWPRLWILTIAWTPTWLMRTTTINRNFK